MLSDPKQEYKNADVDELTTRSDDIAKNNSEKEQIKEEESKYKDWPLKDIKEPLENDVIFGRGAGTNRHNKRFREMVEGFKCEYVRCKRHEKQLVAFAVIQKWRAQSPPGRFLKKDKKTSPWYDCGDGEAKKKVIQLLREGAPQIRQEQGITVEGKNASKDNSVNETPYEGADKITSQAGINHHPIRFRETSLGTFATQLDSCWQDQPQFQGSESSLTSSAKRLSDIEIYDEITDLPGVKRPSLNRDQSAATNRLKQMYCPESLDVDLNALTIAPTPTQLNDSTTTQSKLTASKPDRLNLACRLTTKQAITDWALSSPRNETESSTASDGRQTGARPDPLSSDSRLSTTQALMDWACLSPSTAQADGGLDFQAANISHDTYLAEELQHEEYVETRPSNRKLARQSTTAALEDWAKNNLVDQSEAQRPKPLKKGDRLNTMDLMNFDVDEM